MRPLETGFKCVMRCWDEASRKCVANNFIKFIQHTIPSEILQEDKKNSLVNYLSVNWFSPPWAETMTAERLYQVDLAEQTNPLLLTDNVTERKFKDVDQTYFSGQMNRLISSFVLRLLSSIIGDDLIETGQNSATCESLKFRKRNINRKTKETNACVRALHNVIQKGLVVAYDETSGWAVIRSDASAATKQKTDELPDKFFTGTDSNEDPLRYLEERFPPTESLSKASEIFCTSQNVGLDHSYDVVSKCKKFISSLDTSATQFYRDYVIGLLPEELHEKITGNVHVVNIEHGICTCSSFIVMGQPKFCKHLYAILALRENIKNPEDLLTTFTGSYRSKPFPGYARNVLQFPTKTWHIIDSLKVMSHESSLPEMERAKSGSILQVLHDSVLKIKRVSGKLARRYPHNMGYRRIEGPIPERKYSLADQDHGPDQEVPDPYRPFVVFPERAKEQHGGKRSIRVANRGISFCNTVNDALQTLGKKALTDPVLSQKMDNPICSEDVLLNDNIDPEIPEPVFEEEEQSHSKRPPSSQLDDADSTPLKLKPYMCGLCVNSNESTPYICSSRTQLFTHIMKKHQTALIYCSICWGSGVTTAYFENDVLLERHVQRFHKCPSKQKGLKRNFSKISSGARATLSQQDNPNKKIKLHSNAHSDTEIEKPEQKDNPETQNLAKLRSKKKQFLGKILSDIKTKLWQQDDAKKNIKLVNDADSYTKLKKLIEKKGNPGTQNLAKLKSKKKQVLGKISSDIKTKLCQQDDAEKSIKLVNDADPDTEHENNILNSTCPLCKNICSQNPKKLASIGCDKCFKWFHWRCVASIMTH
ncbi:PREDICTED: uncharacterized protein LOC106812202 [Priapulus caudatus]|uniref:Uncharacterized protein LOC106812202 n=1 Tax=Priapulus caudatus TaxID=37621 RepID=A0ABM1EH41_PRICU|nr:PREDICTED: uncharacterized protein LOC106812202 [Priapulus caudatus]